MLSYPTHLFKIGANLFWINFLANEIRQCKSLLDEMYFIHYFLQIKQNCSTEMANVSYLGF